jgi:YggT family protein
VDLPPDQSARNDTLYLGLGSLPNVHRVIGFDHTFIRSERKQNAMYGSPVYMLLNVVTTFIGIYTLLLVIRVLLTWFPNINWFDPPFSILSQLTDPYLNLFRSIIPPLGGMDFSPMLAIILLQVVSQVLSSVAVRSSFGM